MHKGKKTSSEELLRELRSVIKQYECTLTETIDLNLVPMLKHWRESQGIELAVGVTSRQLGRRVVFLLNFNKGSLVSYCSLV